MTNAKFASDFRYGQRLDTLARQRRLRMTELKTRTFFNHMRNGARHG
jgi:hypothetical protein